MSRINAAIEKLDAINPEEEFAYEKAVLAFALIPSLPVFVHEIESGKRLFRARTHEEYLEKKGSPKIFTFKKDISAAPNNLVKSFARCNRPNQSKFYAGDSIPSAVLELVNGWAETKKEGDDLHVSVGEWVTRKPMKSVIVTTPDKELRKSEYDMFHGEGLDRWIAETKSVDRDLLVEFYRYLYNRFRENAKGNLLTYIITTAYSNVALAHLQGEANCISYPSIPMEGGGTNFAIGQDFDLEKDITLLGGHCLEFTITSKGDDLYHYSNSKSWSSKPVKDGKTMIGWRVNQSN